MVNGFEDVQKVGVETLNRTVESVGALTRGVQSVATETAEFSKKTFEEGAAHLETLLGVKSLERAVEMQTEFLKASCEKMLGQAARFGELYVGVARDVAKPFEDVLPAAAK